MSAEDQLSSEERNQAHEFNLQENRSNHVQFQEPVTYKQEAIAQYQRLNYYNSIKGHYSNSTTYMPSANILRNSIKVPRNLDKGMERFKLQQRGGHNAESTAIMGSFNPVSHHVPKVPRREDLPNGRPLFQRELSKVVPPPDNYDIKRNIGESKKSKTDCLFGAGFEKYRKTCDIQKGIKVFDYASSVQTAGQVLPGTKVTKKQVPGYSVGKAKQNTLWDDEKKRGKETPAPVSYNQDDKIMQVSKYRAKNVTGFDIKCNKKQIKITPGPADYDSMGPSSVVKVSHNYKYNTGGLSRPPVLQSKEQLIINALGAKSNLRMFKHMSDTKTTRSNSNRPKMRLVGTNVKGVNNSCILTTALASGYATSNYAASAQSGRIPLKHKESITNTQGALSEEMTQYTRQPFGGAGSNPNINIERESSLDNIHMMHTPEMGNFVNRSSFPRNVGSSQDAKRKARGVSGNSQKYPRYTGAPNQQSPKGLYPQDGYESENVTNFRGQAVMTSYEGMNHTTLQGPNDEGGFRPRDLMDDFEVNINPNYRSNKAGHPMLSVKSQQYNKKLDKFKSKRGQSVKSVTTFSNRFGANDSALRFDHTSFI